MLIAGYDPHRDSAGYYFDQAEADRYLTFFECGLTHVKGHLALQPIILEPWQRDLISTLFGWRNKETNFRRYREMFLFIARKNG